MGAARSCGAHTTNGEILLTDMLQQCDTGDIILFNNPTGSTYFIKYATGSKWDHVGMILKYNKDKPEETIMIESAGCGVFICYAAQRLRQVLDHPQPTVIGWRKLLGPNNHKQWKTAVHTYAESLINTPYEQNFADFVKAWIGDSKWAKTILSHMGGTFAEATTKGEDLNSVFCSELCAAIFKHAHIMDPKKERDSNAYLPKDFATQSNAHLELQHPWSMQQEMAVLTRIGDQQAVLLETGSKLGAGPNASGKTVNSMITTMSHEDWMAQNEAKAQRFMAMQVLEQAKASGDADLAAQAQVKLDSLPLPVETTVNPELPMEEREKRKAGGCCI